MIELGTSSSSSFYNSSVTSSYKLNEVQFRHEKKDSSDEETGSSTSKNNDIQDTANISNEAKNLYSSEQVYGKKDSQEGKDTEPKLLGSSNTQNSDETESTDTVKSESRTDESSEKQQDAETPKIGKKSSDKLTPEQQQELTKLKKTDADVKAHEQAHLSAASGISASAPSYTYEEGPDGQKYAVGGEVNVSFDETGDPEKDKASAETMKRAALAPADPSSQDRAVARNADKMIAEDEKKIEELKEKERAQKEQDSKEKESSSEKTDKTPENTSASKTLTTEEVAPNTQSTQKSDKILQLQ